jgi:hypothetical protein
MGFQLCEQELKLSQAAICRASGRDPHRPARRPEGRVMPTRTRVPSLSGGQRIRENFLEAPFRLTFQFARPAAATQESTPRR